uniref:Uncharacterized protein n=1 Tax=Nicotiana tabacum TaxID=4097 RepID=A0A1S3Y438_TOBAC|nr:PREDICTED: uncharacterized protein LOC107771718 [Nicotiana tabacum]
MKRKTDRNRRPLEFNIGDKMLLKFTTQIWKKINSKMHHRGMITKYDNPFEVVKKVGERESNVLGDEESQSISFGSSNKIQPITSTQKQVLDDEKKRYTSLTMAERLGLPDFFSLDLTLSNMLLTCVYRFGELLGSAVLVFILDTIVISTLESDVKMPNLIMSILIAITLTILILAVFPVSGGHISPVISFSSALVGLISMTQAIIYITTQCLGAILSALALKAVVSSTIEQRFSLGGCTITVIDDI